MDALTPAFLLTWSLVAVSLFNTILLLWLGITLWLSADRRHAGIVVTAGGFLLGSLFFISHSALLLNDRLQLTRSNTLWLAVGMMPAILLPFLWYTVLLWYNGYWTQEDAAGQQGNRLRQRQRAWLWLTASILVAGFVSLVLLGIPYVPLVNRFSAAILPLRELVKTRVAGIPLLAIGFPVYVLLCVLLSLDALHRPGATARLMGDLARRRARPWLTAASLLLVLVSLLLAVVLIWTVSNTYVGGYYILAGQHLEVIGIFDLAISLLIASAVVMLGQATTSYEVFTGKSLPRQALARQWRQAILLAAGYGLLMGGALAWGLEPVYAVLLTALLMTAFFALLSWRTYLEWEHSARQLRPFVASQHWYDSLIVAPESDEPIGEPFVALCERILHTSLAYLVPAGPTAAFVGPQAYPPGRDAPALSGLPALPAEGQAPILAVDPQEAGGAIWAVPLRRERGLIGVLLLGPRSDDSLYTREDVEIARTAGERLIDTAASIALSRRLMRLQRERLAATQMLDQRTRRVLHDEVLPLIHTAMLALPAGDGTDVALHRLSEAHNQVSNLLRELPAATTPEVARLGLLAALQKMVEGEFAPAFDGVEWRNDDDVEQAAARLSPLQAETLYYATRELVRNAARHARPAGSDGKLHLILEACVQNGQLCLSVEDNGTGEARRAAKGHGLELHSTLMAIAGGSLLLESVPSQATRARLLMPLSQPAVP